MTLQDLLEKQYGVKTDIRINPLVTQVQTTLTQLLKPDPNRLAWTLINLGSNALYVGFDEQTSTTRGVYVAATGGVFSLLFNEDFSLVAFPVYAITTVAAADIYLVEVIALV